jgi:hypothetical protein
VHQSKDKGTIVLEIAVDVMMLALIPAKDGSHLVPTVSLSGTFSSLRDLQCFTSRGYGLPLKWSCLVQKGPCLTLFFFYVTRVLHFFLTGASAFWGPCSDTVAPCSQRPQCGATIGAHSAQQSPPRHHHVFVEWAHIKLVQYIYAPPWETSKSDLAETQFVMSESNRIQG